MMMDSVVAKVNVKECRMKISDSDSAWSNGVVHVALVREMEMADDVGN